MTGTAVDSRDIIARGMFDKLTFREASQVSFVDTFGREASRASFVDTFGREA